MYEKTEARSIFRTLRKELKNAEKDDKITKFALDAFGAYESFFVYISIGTEVGTERIIEELKKRGKKICVPRVFDKEMRSVRLSDKLHTGAFGILEPQGDTEETCAVAFTPMLAADKAGYRLGYGGGFYDKYFSGHETVLRVGLSYEGQLTDELYHEKTDMKLDAVVTENGIKYFPGNRIHTAISGGMENFGKEKI